MIFSSKESVEDRVIRELLNGEKTAKGIVGSIQKQNSSVTIQGVYRVLQTLIAEEIVIKRDKGYSLLEEWRKKVVESFEKIPNQLFLSEGESIQYELKSLVHLDQQWKNIIFSLNKEYPNFPVFLYNPYNIWIRLGGSRKESEVNYYKSFTEGKTYGFFGIKYASPYDTDFKKEFQSDFFKVTFDNQNFLDTDYPTIFADYIITTRISKQTTEKIKQAYEASSSSKELEENLQKIGIEKKKVKLIIERNREKAKKLRKKLSREFFVPKEIIKEFDLY